VDRELTQQIYLLADELRGLSAMAGHFARDPYERERADQIRHVAARLAALVDAAPYPEIDRLFTEQAWPRVSPAIGVDAVVLDPTGRVLLCQRRDDQRWCLPGGLAEIGQPTSEAVLRELWEEAGLRGEVTRLLGVFDGPRWGSLTKVHLIHVVYQVSCDRLDPSPGTEMITTEFFAPDQLPGAMHPGHDLRVPVCLELVHSGRVHHDPASSVLGDLPMHQRPETDRGPVQ